MGKSRGKRRGADVASAAKTKKQAKTTSKPRKRLRTVAHGTGGVGPGGGGSLTGG